MSGHSDAVCEACREPAQMGKRYAFPGSPRVEAYVYACACRRVERSTPDRTTREWQRQNAGRAEPKP